MFANKGNDEYAFFGQDNFGDEKWELIIINLLRSVF